MIWGRFVRDFKRYYNFAKFSAKSDLKAEVASSFLNWLWWILDPLMFMLVYTFIAIIVFKSKVEYFPIFVFVGLTLWNFFSKTIQASVSLIKTYKDIVSRVYLPKYILILQRCMVNAFKMMISFILVIVMMFIYQVPVTPLVVFIIPIVIIEFFVTFGICCIVTHFGVFVDDLNNVVRIILQLLFYMSGIFYSIKGRIEEPFATILLSANPMSTLIESARNCLLYSSAPYYKQMAAWAVAGLALSYIGLRIIYKNENSYVKIS